MAWSDAAREASARARRGNRRINPTVAVSRSKGIS